jgi:hypothetical protein
MQEKEKDIAEYQGQAEAYRQQAELLRDKAFAAGLPEEVKNALSKLDVIDSIIASISLGDIELYEIETLLLVLKRCDHITDGLSICKKTLDKAITLKSTATPVESGD